MNIISGFRICLFLFLSSCTSSNPYQAAEINVISKLNQEAKSYGLDYLSHEGTFNNSPIMPISFFFYSYQKADVNTARKLLVNNVENLIQLANSDPELKNHILNYPIDYKDFKFFILFYLVDQYDKFVPLPYLAGVYVSRGLVDYFIVNSSTGKLEVLSAESYQRARGIVEHQNSLLNLQSLTN